MSTSPSSSNSSLNSNSNSSPHQSPAASSEAASSLLDDDLPSPERLDREYWELFGRLGECGQVMAETVNLDGLEEAEKKAAILKRAERLKIALDLLPTLLKEVTDKKKEMQQIKIERDKRIRQRLEAEEAEEAQRGTMVKVIEKPKSGQLSNRRPDLSISIPSTDYSEFRC